MLHIRCQFILYWSSFSTSRSARKRRNNWYSSWQDSKIKAERWLSHRFPAKHGFHLPNNDLKCCSSTTGFSLCMWVWAGVLRLDGHYVQEQESSNWGWTWFPMCFEWGCTQDWPTSGEETAAFFESNCHFLLFIGIVVASTGTFVQNKLFRN